MLISRFNLQGWWWLASQTNVLVGGGLVWACCQQGLWDVSCNPRWQVNQISQTAALHLPLHHPNNSGPVLQAEETGLAQSVFLGMGCKPKVLLAAPLFLFSSGACSLQWWADTCVWWVGRSSHNHARSVLSACLFLCTTYFCRHWYCCVYLVQGTGGENK